MSHKIAILNSGSESAQAAESELKAAYETVAPEDADVLIALGGDGFMLHVLHNTLEQGKPVFGMHAGSVGFLMNSYRAEGLMERLQKAEQTVLHPLRMTAHTQHGSKHHALAINEVSLLRETRQAAKLRILVDGKVRMEELICDGALVATPAGSTAYNLSAHGPIIPLDGQVLALTPISAFRPRRWRGALVPHTSTVQFEILEAAKRPVSAVADNFEVRDVTQVTVSEDRETRLRMLHDPGFAMADRILEEQFQN